MKTSLPLITALVLGTVAATAQGQQLETKDDLPPAPGGKTWKLVWHDEFTGTKLDTTKWDIPEYKRRDGYWSRKAISLDGKEMWRTDAGGVCQVPEYLKLSDEIGNWAGDITKASMPDQFLVDYVRVYDLVDKE